MGCGSGFPLWEDYQYKGVLSNTKVDEHSLYLAQDGAYVLNIYEIDSTIGRKKFTLYYPQSSPELKDTTNKADQVFLYFIDKVRFVYSRKKLEKIKLKNILGKHKIGLYQIYEESDGTPIVVLYLSNAEVKNRKSFNYGRIFLKRRKKNLLTFERAEYPKSSDQNSRFTVLDTDYLDGNKLGFHAEWKFNDSVDVKLIYNKSEVAKILYNDSTRLYLNSADSLVGSERYKSEDRKSF